jgi:two-component system cell cycle response regulator DivK
MLGPATSPDQALLAERRRATYPFRARAHTRPDRTRQRAVVLVIDDEHANLLLARALLEVEGFGVRTATDAASAWAVLKTCEPDLILMDIQLPGMDGWELTRRLKANPTTSHVPIIGMSAYGRPDDVERARALGFDEFIAKPVSTRELPGIIRRHLR